MKRKILFLVSLILVVFLNSCATFQQVDRKVIDRDINMKRTEWIYYR